jgi:hypothetical protein
MRNLTALLMVIFSTGTFASDESFNWLNSTSNQNSALSGSCDYVNTSDLKCNLRQLNVRKKVSDEDSIKNLNEIENLIDSGLQNQTAEAFMESEFPDFCTDLESSEVEVDEGTYSVYKKMCQETSRESIIGALSYSAKMEAETCNVMEYDVGDYIFERINENKWVSTNKPSGLCGAVTLLSLEREPESPSLWSYSQVRHYTNTETETCKKLDEINEPMSYSWQGKNNIEMNCKFIQFGL